MKTCSIYASKPYGLALLALGLSALAAAFARFALHQDLRVTAAILFGPPLLAVSLFFICRRPIIRVDQRGVTFRQRWLPRIVWTDVGGVTRAPMVEPTVDGLIFHLEDDRRPVLVVLRNADKYLKRLPGAIRTGLIVERERIRYFRIDFTGLSPASGKVYACIRYQLAAIGVGKTQKIA